MSTFREQMNRVRRGLPRYRKEEAVVALIVEGLTNLQIAMRLEVSEGHIKQVNQFIFRRYRVANRHELICKVLGERHGEKMRELKMQITSMELRGAVNAATSSNGETGRLRYPRREADAQ